MKTITAKSSLSAAGRTQARGESDNRRRFFVVVPILAFSLLASFVSFVVLLMSDAFVTADARKALASIGILGILLCGASIYSLSAICWNAFWIERGKRVDAESELRETEEAIPKIVRESIRQIPEQEQFDQKIGELTSNPESKDWAKRVFSVVAGNDLVTHQFVMDVQSSIIDSEFEAHAEQPELV